jgi:hypothetical protein
MTKLILEFLGRCRGPAICLIAVGAFVVFNSFRWRATTFTIAMKFRSRPVSR